MITCYTIIENKYTVYYTMNEMCFFISATALELKVNWIYINISKSACCCPCCHCIVYIILHSITLASCALILEMYIFLGTKFVFCDFIVLVRKSVFCLQYLVYYIHILFSFSPLMFIFFFWPCFVCSVFIFFIVFYHVITYTFAYSSFIGFLDIKKFILELIYFSIN